MTTHARPRYILFAIAILILHNEFVVYLAVRLFIWSSINCQSNDNCTRLLLVADPQIIGETFDTNGYNVLAIRDSDRFLSATFAQAISHSQPNAVVFLGDLMDEGSVANDEQFERYVHRFNRIYGTGVRTADTEAPLVMHIPGDNDIGGETFADIVTEAKVARFRRHFRDVDHLDVGNRTRIVNVNLLTQRTPDVTAATTPAHMWRVIVTHMSLLQFPGFASERVCGFSSYIHNKYSR